MLRRMAIFPLLAALLFLAGCGKSAPAPAPQPNAPTAAESKQAPTPAQQAAPAQAAPAQSPTQDPAKLNQEAAWPADVLDVAWAPDSRRMAVLTGKGLAVLDISSRSLAPWPVTVSAGSRLVGWRYDGQTIYLQTADHVLQEVDASWQIKPLSDNSPNTNIDFFPAPDAPVVMRRWIGNISGKFQLIGGKGAWEGIFLNWAPKGRYFTYREESVMHLVDLQTGANRVLPAGGSPIWQPGGQLLMLVGNDTLISDVNGKVLATVPGARQAAWSADGTRILFADTEAIWTVNADGSNKQLLTKAALGPTQGFPVWLAQDEVVYMTVGKPGPGGTPFYPNLIAGGKISGLSASSNGVHPHLYVSPDRRHVAYISGSPSESEPGQLVIYPEKP